MAGLDLTGVRRRRQEGPPQGQRPDQTEVKGKLQLLREELRDGIRSSPKYTVRNAVDDWLANGLDGRSAKTISRTARFWLR
jgi:hypothetical protein